MIVAIAAAFPLHKIEGYSAREPSGHYATWLPQIARAFATYQDMEVHWITLDSEAKAPVSISSQNQKFHILPSSEKGRASSLYREDMKQISGLLAEIKPDLVHGWGTEDVYGLAAAFSGYPNMVSLQGIMSHYALKTKMANREYLQAILEIPVLWKAGLLTVESHWGRKVLKRRAPFAQIELVEYGVDDAFFAQAWKPDPTKPTAIFVGSVAERKGIADAVRAFDSPELSQARLLVYGDGGAYADELKRRSPSNVIWCGRQPTANIIKAMSEAWCLVLPTRADTSPNVVKEARVIGLPVVTTSCGGQSDYVFEGENGFLVDPGAIELLRMRLMSIFKASEIILKMGSMYWSEQRDFFKPGQTAAKLIKIYKQF